VPVSNRLEPTIFDAPFKLSKAMQRYSPVPLTTCRQVRGRRADTEGRPGRHRGRNDQLEISHFVYPTQVSELENPVKLPIARSI
jgi:hypothetical protein